MQEIDEAFFCAGQMAVQGNVGGGSFVCGLKRILTPRDSIEMQAALGALTSPILNQITYRFFPVHHHSWKHLACVSRSPYH